MTDLERDRLMNILDHLLALASAARFQTEKGETLLAALAVRELADGAHGLSEALSQYAHAEPRTVACVGSHT